MVLSRTREIIYAPSEIIDVSTAIGSGDVSYDPPLRGISIGGAGAVKVDTPNSSAKTLASGVLAAGAQHFMLITKVYQTGTTATNIIGWR